MGRRPSVGSVTQTMSAPVSVWSARALSCSAADICVDSTCAESKTNTCSGCGDGGTYLAIGGASCAAAAVATDRDNSPAMSRIIWREFHFNTLVLSNVCPHSILL